MAWGSLIAGLVPAVNKMGSGVRQRTEGPGSYNLTTGKFHDARRVEDMSVVGASLNPIKAFSSKYYTPQEKWSMVLSGPFGAFAAKKKYRERIEAERAKMGAKYTAISDKIEGLTDYEISQEARDRLSGLQESGEEVRDITGEATDIAEARASRDLPGMDLYKRDVRQDVANKIEAIQQIGGSGSLNAITEAGLEEQGNLSELNKENLSYKMQSQKDLSNALMSEARAGIEATQMGAAGLQGMVQERGKAYESKLNKELTGIDWDINKLAVEQMGYQAQAQASAAAGAGAASALSQIGSAYLANRGAK